MNYNDSFEVKSYNFNSNLFNEFQNINYANDLWPVVYILSDGQIKEAYVGETTDTYSRLATHLKSNVKSKLTTVHLISSEKFNKSATLDIESNLIKYISADGQYKLINGNIGLANHNYYQKKEVYWDIFTSIWGKLRAQGISKHSIEYINNSDLFKYSPYKTLSLEQKFGLMLIMKNLLSNNQNNIIVEGGAGTGKTILAIFLFKLLNTNNEDFNFKEFGEDETEFIRIIKELKNKFPNPKMALVVPMSSFRNTLKKVFKNIKGLNTKMVIGPAELASEEFDIVVVDESHRLRRRVNLGAYFGAFDKVCGKLKLDKNVCSELDWVLLQSNNSIFFYDENQSIKPSDVIKEDFDKLKLSSNSKIEYLKSQFRVKGGNDYVNYIQKLLNVEIEKNSNNFKSKEYDFLLFDNIEDLINEIKQKNGEYGLSRLIAGYSWPWISKNDKSLFDINIENTALQWNRVADDWINSDNSINEVGCIHTTQGYDLNYSGIIFGNEISFDKEKKEIIILKENYFDRNGSQSIRDPNELKAFILNIYKTIMLRGIKGTYVYVCDKNLKEYFQPFLEKFQPKRSIEILSESRLIPFENSIPLFNLKAAAGDFSLFQIIPEQYQEVEWVALPSRYKASSDLFACKVIGDSMNKIIPNGSICLFRKYGGGSRNGKIVLAQYRSIQDPDSGSGFTVKEYHSIKKYDDDQWSHDSITLKPLSYENNYNDIELIDDPTNPFIIVGMFECVLY